MDTTSPRLFRFGFCSLCVISWHIAHLEFDAYTPLISGSLQRELEGEESGKDRGGGRTVTFERAFTSRASGLVRQMREQLQKSGMDDDIEVRRKMILEL